MYEIDIQMATTSTQIPTEDNFVLWIDCVFNKCNTSGDLTLRIVDSDESQALNAQYRQKDYATNVLSFPADLPPDLELNLLGDLVICAPVVMAEAAQQHKTLNAHWAHMVVHGTLHLLGYDHETDEDAHIMETLETELLTSLGFPAPYEIL